MSKLFCVNCGHELSSNDESCPACGMQVPHARTAENVPSANAQPARAETAAPIPVRVISAAQPTEAKDKSFGWCTWVIVGFVALTLLIGALALARCALSTSQSVFSSDKGSSSSSSNDESGFLHDLKELHSATKELKRSWHEDVEVPFEKLKESMKTGSKGDVDEEDFQWPKVEDEEEDVQWPKRTRRSSAW